MEEERLAADAAGESGQQPIHWASAWGSVWYVHSGHCRPTHSTIQKAEPSAWHSFHHTKR